MVCGTDKTKSVSIKNVVYREIFDAHSQIEPMEEIDEICSLLNDNFPSSPLTITSPMLDTVTPAMAYYIIIRLDESSISSLHFQGNFYFLIARKIN